MSDNLISEVRPRYMHGLCLGFVALALFATPAASQSVYRDYEDGARDELSDEEIRRLSIDRNGSSQVRSYGEERYDEAPPYEGDDYNERSDVGGGSLKDGDVGDVNYFYEELESDGRWFEHEEYGYVWTPYRVAGDWRPYTRGRWVMTDTHGWFWVSDEPFGWATYHYGRWFHDRRHGWVWVPGTRWGPAWVAWRESDDYIGWAPLPPDAYWEPRRSTVIFRDSLYEGPQYAIYWSFLAPAYFTVADPWRYYAPRTRVHYIVTRSRSHTHYSWRNRTIYNVGIPVQRIERATRRPVPRLQAAFRDTRPSRSASASLSARNTLEVYRPNLSRHAVEERRKGRDIPGVVQRDGANVSSPRQRSAWRDVDRRAASVAPNRRDVQGRDANPRNRIDSNPAKNRDRDRVRATTPWAVPPSAVRRQEAVRDGIDGRERARSKQAEPRQWRPATGKSQQKDEKRAQRAKVPAETARQDRDRNRDGKRDEKRARSGDGERGRGTPPG